MTANEVKDLIMESDLPEDAKSALLVRLAAEGATDAFTEALGDALLKDTQRRVDTFVDTVSTFDDATSRIDADYAAKEQALLDKVNTALADLDPQDLAARKAVWDEYYRDHEALMKERYAATESLVSKAILASVE
jgi:hypothetical protein